MDGTSSTDSLPMPMVDFKDGLKNYGVLVNAVFAPQVSDGVRLMTSAGVGTLELQGPRGIKSDWLLCFGVKADLLFNVEDGVLLGVGVHYLRPFEESVTFKGVPFASTFDNGGNTA